MFSSGKVYFGVDRHNVLTLLNLPWTDKWSAINLAFLSPIPFSFFNSCTEPLLRMNNSSESGKKGGNTSQNIEQTCGRNMQKTEFVKNPVYFKFKTFCRLFSCFSKPI